MLYRSTRNKLDAFTAYRALRLNNDSNSGIILPMRVPVIDDNAIEKMKSKDFLQNVADVLNLFFGTEFTAWDMESTIGKTPVQLVECGQKVMLAQIWKNPASQFEYYQKSLFALLCPEYSAKPTSWARVAIRIALIAASVLNLSEKESDVAVNCGDFEQVLAVYYCRKMGVPIRKILIACNENSNIWDFVYRGTIHSNASLQNTAYPALDKVIPDLFEAYLFLSYGQEETQRFLNAAADKQDYQLTEQMALPANDDLFVSVVGQERIPAVINSFRTNNGLFINPYTAFSLGVLQDYRAKAGESCLTLIFEEAAP